MKVTQKEGILAKRMSYLWESFHRIETLWEGLGGPRSGGQGPSGLVFAEFTKNLRFIYTRRDAKQSLIYINMGILA